MKLKFRPQSGKKGDVELEINGDLMVEKVRQKVTEKSKCECYKIQHKGQTLRDDQSLKSYGVTEGSILMIQSEFDGQYMPYGVTPDMEKQGEKRKAEEGPELAEPELAPEVKRLATQIAHEDVHEATIGWIHAQAAVHGEKGMRRQMEDEHLICPSLKALIPELSDEHNFAVLGILDGHGGKQVANFVKTYLAAEIGTALTQEEAGPLSDKKLKKAINAAFGRLDARIATELAGCYDGCCATVLLVNETHVYCACLGDSMAYLCRKPEGEDLQPIPLQARQHKCWMMKEKERILRAGGAVENGRINGVLEVSRAFGDITLKKFGVLCSPDFMKFEIDRTKDKCVIVGCDSFWNSWAAPEATENTLEKVEEEEMLAESEKRPADLRAVCNELVTHSIEEMKSQDNVSVLILRFAPAEGEA